MVAEGRAIGQKIGSGVARVVRSLDDMSRVQPGDVLVADMTDPDWEPVMKRSAAIVTNRGGRTCHAAIIARELGVPAVVGTGNALDTIQDGQRSHRSAAPKATPASSTTAPCPSSASSTDLEQHAAGAAQDHDERRQPGARVRLRACCRNAGIGLARLEMIIASHIGVHPKALLEYAQQDAETKKKIDAKIAGYGEPGRLLRRPPGRRHRDDHRLVRAAPGDRAPVGLQVERIRQPDRRQRATSRTKRTR